MKCQRTGCEWDLPPGNPFCGHCGMKQIYDQKKIKCSCGSENSADSNFCGICGEPVTKEAVQFLICPGNDGISCGAKIQLSSSLSFCVSCGWKIDRSRALQGNQTESKVSPILKEKLETEFSADGEEPPKTVTEIKVENSAKVETEFSSDTGVLPITKSVKNEPKPNPDVGLTSDGSTKNEQNDKIGMPTNFI